MCNSKRTMLVLELISPKEVTDKIICYNCGLEYSGDHYRILLDNKKLAYFEIVHMYYDTSLDFKPECTCHGCLFKLLKHIGSSTEEKVKMKLIYNDNPFYMSYDPEDPQSLW